eukprot:144860-Chlamydomonas_euryale.AAC.2
MQGGRGRAWARVQQACRGRRARQGRVQHSYPTNKEDVARQGAGVAQAYREEGPRQGREVAEPCCARGCGLCGCSLQPVLSRPSCENPLLPPPIPSYPGHHVKTPSYPLLPPPIPSYPLLSPPIPSYPLLSPPIPSYPLLSRPSCDHFNQQPVQQPPNAAAARSAAGQAFTARARRRGADRK